LELPQLSLRIARRLVLEAVIENFRRGARRLSGSVLEPFTNLSESDAEQLGSVYSLVMGLLSETAACPEEFVSRAEGILFTDARGEIAHTIAISICELRPGIVGVIERAQLAREVLPSLLALEIAIDVRLRVVDGRVTTSIPVALLHIDTDSERQELWLQLSRGDVEETIKKLQKCLIDMQLAENIQYQKSLL
jgi:hypothetical protein